MKLFATYRTHNGVESLWGIPTEHRAAQEREVKRVASFSDKWTTYRIAEFVEAAYAPAGRPSAPNALACDCETFIVRTSDGTESTGRILCDPCLAKKEGAS